MSYNRLDPGELVLLSFRCVPGVAPRRILSPHPLVLPL